MADVRCPMCGKPNPADAKLCRYCQARLKPLGPSLEKNSPPGATPPPLASQPPADGDATDWLRGLLEPSGGANAPEESSPGEAGQADENSGDWLSRIVPPAPAKPVEPAPDDWLNQMSTPSSSPAAAGDDLSSWLASLRDEDDSSSAAPQTPAIQQPSVRSSDDWMNDFQNSPAESPAALPGDVPDWLKKMQSTSSAPEVPPAPVASSATPLDDLPDWMNDFQNGPADTPPAQPDASLRSPSPSTSKNDDVPDWLSEFTAPAPEPIQTPPQVSQDPDWLADFRAPISSEPPPAPATPTAPEEVPDWLREFQNPPAQPSVSLPPAVPPVAPAVPEEVPDWLSEFQSPPAQSPVSLSPAAPPATPTAPEEVPDWLREFQSPPAQPPVSLPPAAPPATPAAPEEAPDWLREFQAGPTVPAVSPRITQPVSSPTPPEETPDWLRDFQSSPTSQTLEESPTTAQAGASDENPDWLKDFYSSSATDATSAQPKAETDWMKDLGNVESTSPKPGESRALVGMEAEEALPGADLPDWLRSTAQPAAQDATQASQDMPDWLKKSQPAESGRSQPFSPQPPIAEDAASPFASHEMNELLAGVSSEGVHSSETSGAFEGENLEPAQLPNWLQAMRPVESGVSSIPTSEVDDSRVEKSGPLAGLRGVLPGEDLMSKYRKPPIYTNKLQVSEKQHLHASLLEGLVNEEAQSQPLSGDSILTASRQLITRLLVAILLIVLILLPALTGFRISVPAGLRASQPGAAAMAQSIGSLSPDAYVLVVADFEAGLTGELKAAAQPVLRDLQKRQARVVVASTLPTGPVLGEMLLKDAQITPLANLGYLAGGAQTLKRLGMLASAELPNPLAQVIPFLYPGGRSWNDIPALQGVRDITSFQRILVLTDNVETARAWVEQVQPGLGSKTQLVMISSAQAAPLVRTYLESGQVHGLVSGLAGGAAYEQITSKPGLAADSWTAYQLSMLGVILLIIAGAVSAGLSNLLRRNKKRKA